MNKTLYIIIILLFNLSLTFGQNIIEVPEFNDDYSKTIQKLENGQTDINYKTFRDNFIKSDQFKVASKKNAEFKKLTDQMYNQMSESDFNSVISTTKQMLSIDYTSMKAHQILRQTYKIIGDTINADKYKTIQFGLLNSIVNNGDGKSCETGWPVIQISEEYFILEMLDVKLIEQAIDNKNGVCDRMEVKNENGEKSTYYFEISKVFEGRQKL
ncbi:MAG: DUF4919 domain-containing protein [Lutibacter sp.]